ncbi:MAG: hypothetical protein IJ446_04270 [Oscillospiraceae bacterium]|nr:hypothetical protein [Oscillospiraceae bacterium]
MKKSEAVSRPEPMGALKLFHVSAPIIAALFLFLASAGYIVYRLVSNYNYNERWKDYDECGLG